MKKNSRKISSFLIMAFLNLVIGCNYYHVKTLPPAKNSIPLLLKKQNEAKYLILHQEESVWHLKNIYVDNDKKQMMGMLAPLTVDHEHYKTARIPGANRYRTNNLNLSGNPTYEVHIYISEYVEDGNQIAIPFTSIKKIELYDLDVGATVASYFFSTLGIMLGALVVIGAIIALTKSSCPFVYVSDGKTYHFTGELYGGAIYSSLERDDYMPMPALATNDGCYQIKIANELLERQYTNLAELITVEHPAGSKILIDRKGVVQTFSAPLPPLTAQSGHTDYSSVVKERDSSAFLFNEDSIAGNDLSNLTLSFKRPPGSTSGKLIVNAKNSFWLDFVYGKFNEQFGTAFDRFSQKQKQVPADKNIQWSLEQGIPLSVYVDTEKGWEYVDYFNVIGPLASRDMVMAVDLSRVKGENIKIKLQCGFMFWEVDYAAMDFSENVPLKVQHVSPASATDENGNDVANLLVATDAQYLAQPEAGNATVVTYPTRSPAPGFSQTSFLHTRGYYEYIRDYRNKPDLIYLNSFRKKGAFTRFSKDHYFEFVNHDDVFAAALNDKNGN